MKQYCEEQPLTRTVCGNDAITVYMIAKIRKISKISAENVQFLKLKKLCLLHGHVFVMGYYKSVT